MIKRDTDPSILGKIVVTYEMIRRAAAGTAGGSVRITPDMEQTGTATCEHAHFRARCERNIRCKMYV